MVTKTRRPLGQVLGNINNLLGTDKGGIVKELRSVLRGRTAQKSVLALIDQGVVSAANFSTGLILGRLCSKEQFGLYMLGFTIVTFIINLQGFLISTPYTIYSPRLHEKELTRYTGSTLIHQIFLSMFTITMLGLAGILMYLGLGSRQFLPVIDSLVWVIGFIMLWDYARRISLAALKMRGALVLDICVALLQVGSLLILAKLGLLSASRAYWGWGAACIAVGLGWILFMRGHIRIEGRHILKDLRQNLATGIWIFFSGLLWSISTYLYPWILAIFHGTSSAAVWGACHGVVALCNPLYMGLQNSFTPKIAHVYATSEIKDLRRFTLKATAVLGMSILPFALIFLAFGGRLVSLLYGHKYGGNDLIVAILGLNLLVASISFSPSRALFTIQRADVDFKINLLSVVLLFSVGIFLVREFGVAGAAAGLLLSNSGSLILFLLAFSKLVRGNGVTAVDGEAV